jgi:hypothetical protein
LEPLCDQQSDETSPLGTLEILPPELIFRILDFMHPHEYSSFPCTCRRDLSLVNRKLQVAEYCYTTLTSWKSATAPYVNMQNITLPPWEIGWENMSGCYAYNGEDDDDL